MGQTIHFCFEHSNWTMLSVNTNLWCVGSSVDESVFVNRIRGYRANYMQKSNAYEWVTSKFCFLVVLYCMWIVSFCHWYENHNRYFLKCRSAHSTLWITLFGVCNSFVNTKCPWKVVWGLENKGHCLQWVGLLWHHSVAAILFTYWTWSS